MPNRWFSALRTALGSSHVAEASPKDVVPHHDPVLADLRWLRSEVEALRGTNPALHERQQAWLSSLERRLGAPDLAREARKALLAELRVLDLESRLARKQSERSSAWTPGSRHPAHLPPSDLKRLKRVRREFGNALLSQLDHGEDVAAAVVWQHLGELFKRDPAAHGAALNALDELQDASDPRRQQLAAQVCDHLASMAQRFQAKAGASSAPRETCRMPNDVLMHLSCTIADALQRHPGDPTLNALAAKAQRAFLAHEVNAAMVRKMAGDAAGRLFQLQEHQASRQCLQFLRQLPARTESESVSQHRLQLHDNPYGRVFDSRFAAHVVESPPPGMLAGVETLSRAYAQRMTDTPVNRAAAVCLKKLLRGDPRSWAPRVPAILEIVKAPDGEGARQAIADFLGTTPRDGPDAIARLYLIAMFAVYQRLEAAAQGRPDERPAHLDRCQANYDRVIQVQAVREPTAIRGRTALTTGTGITLRHQPATDGGDARLGPSHRPAAVYRIGKEGATEADPDAATTTYSRAVDLQHERGLPVGSGVSGTTNMLLHLYAEMKESGMTGVPAREFVLACATMLNYDGGHSMHEALWTANQLDEPLGLGLAMSDAGSYPLDFVSNYDAFIDGFGDSTRAVLRQASDQAWSDTQHYLRTHSHFARNEPVGSDARRGPVQASSQ